MIKVINLNQLTLTDFINILKPFEEETKNNNYTWDVSINNLDKDTFTVSDDEVNSSQGKIRKIRIYIKEDDETYYEILLRMII